MSNQTLKLQDHPHMLQFSSGYLAESTVERSQEKRSLWLLKSVCPNLALNSIQATVFQQSWQGKTYAQIARSTRYDPSYLKDVGHRLWRQLSVMLGEPVTKHNLYTVLEQRFHTLQVQRGTTPFGAAADSSPTTMLKINSNTVCDCEDAVPVFIGRDAEIKQLKTWILDAHSCLVGIFGFGGVGKTALAIKLTEQISPQFDYVLWRSLRNTPPFEEFVSSLLESILGEPVAELPSSPEVQVSLLLQQLSEHRCLLVIDDWSSILQSRTIAGLYQTAHEPYGFFLRRMSERRHQSCVLITSREQPVGLAFKANASFPIRSLHLRGLTGEAGRAVMRVFGLSEQEDDLINQLLAYYSGNLYALRVAAQTIVDLLGGQVQTFIDHSALNYGEIRQLLDQQVNRLSKLEQRVITCIAHHLDPIKIEDLEQELENDKPLLLEALESLYHRSFIEKEELVLTSPPFLKTYLTHQLSHALDWAETALSPAAARVQHLQVQHLDDYRV
jgi:hypothetical protein